MKRSALTLLALTLVLLACARSGAARAPSTDSTRTLLFGGIERSYILHIPPSYDGNHALPLVLDFHGGGGNAESQRHTSGFESLADEKGFIVVYPNGTGRLGEVLLTWNGGTCCGYAVTKDVDDVGFVRALITDLQSVAKIDMKRIYATGLSNGGIFSYRLACDAADLIAAIGPVAGTLNSSPCNPKGPVSVIHFHGTADEHLPYDGGIGDKSLAGVDFASVKDSIDFWVGFDQCPTSPQTESFADIRHEVYSDCANGTAIELYTIVGGKHAWPGSDGPAWPGGDQPTQTISASKLLWDFFSAHPKP
jgi:polyhydroxybutyrate depolymerase